MDSFTYIISSSNSTTAATANNCFIELAGLPTNRKFRCEVIDFALNYNTIDTTNMVEKYLFLTASNEMQILDGVQHPQKFNKLCNISVSTGAMTSLFGHVFTVGNFNKHIVNFQIGLPNNTLLPTNRINQTNTTYWTLSLKMTPIAE
jgi:hypothetical protein